MKKRKKGFGRFLALLMTVMMTVGMLPTSAFATAGDGRTAISGAADFPMEIKEGETYVLTTDLTLSADQQITTIAGTLDGQGHTITLSGKALADTVTGTIQNLGVAGTVSGTENMGSFAMHFNGRIWNCFSKVTVAISGWSGEGAGFAAGVTGGEICNSFFAGTANGGFGPAFTIGENGSTISLNHAVAAKEGSYGNHYMGSTNVKECYRIGDEKVSSWAEAIDILNTDIPDTGYQWVLLEGADLPSLQDKNSAGVNRSALERAIEEASRLVPEKDKYTESSWKAVEDALAAAKAAPEDADQAAVNVAVRALNDAVKGLVRQRPATPVALPTDGSLIEISSAAELADIDNTAGKYYVLTQDITLGTSYQSWMTGEFQGVLDGQGHTITFDKKTRLFGSGTMGNIGEDGVIQNISFQGTLGNITSDGEGFLGRTMKGAILNCSSNITQAQSGKFSGFAQSLDGGVISNCYVTGAPAYAFVSAKNSGSILSSYWEQGISNPVSMDTGSAVPGKEMRTLEFVQIMNQGRGANGREWGQNSDGYPYFGPDLSYTEPGSGFSEYKMAFTPNGGTAQLLEDGTLTVLLGDVDSFKYAGYLSIAGYSVPAGYKIQWGSSDGDIRTDLDDGHLNVAKAGEALITATLADADGNPVKTLSTLKVTVLAGNVQDIKLYIDGKDVTNGSFTVAGSEWKSIAVKAKYDDGSQEYRDITYSQFTFVSSDEAYIFKEPQYSSFHFEKPGTASITVAYRGNSAVKAMVNLTSTYVEAKSITPGIAGTYTIHGRNANDWQSSPPRFNPEYNGVTIEPANASYNSADYYTVTSSDPKIGLWFEGGYVPVGAGTVTYTATHTDPRNGKTITGSSKVVYQYENPLTGFAIKESSFTMKANGELALPIRYTGQKDADGWNITEPSVVWSYSKDGIVEISRKNTNGYWKRDESAPDNNMFVVDTEYTLYALEEGSVAVTGTPRDTTGGAKPITFTVTVAGSEDLPVVDIDRIVSEGIASAADYLNSQNLPYVYGSEWLVFTMERAGREISGKNRNDYYNSVATEIPTWSARKKPTDIARVSLALTSIGMDITDVNSVDLAAMLYNHSSLESGSNELTYALIALDAAGVEIPKDARWTREKMKDALLAFQKEDGGFALDKNGSSGLDTTAMALQALAPYKGETKVSAAIEEAVAYLKAGLSRPLYGYNTSEAQAQVIIALAALELDPLENGFGTKYRNIFSSLEDSYRAAGGGFSHLAGEEADNMASLQVLQALEAYRRYTAGEKSFWDMAQEGGFVPGPAPEETVLTLPDVNGAGITVTGSNSILNKNTELKADTVTSGAKYEIVKEALKAVSSKFLLFDIFLLENNVRIRPDGSITLSIPVPEGYDGTKCKVFYISDDGSIVTDMNAAYQDGCMVFATDHFSLYALAEVADGNNTGGAGNTGGNGTGNSQNLKAPRTDDASSFTLWMLLALVSLTLLAAMARKNHRNKYFFQNR